MLHRFVHQDLSGCTDLNCGKKYYYYKYFRSSIILRYLYFT